jgi:hypothetical protein
MAAPNDTKARATSPIGHTYDDVQDSSGVAAGLGGGLSTNAAEHPVNDNKTALAMVRFMVVNRLPA